MNQELPSALAGIVEDFATMPAAERLPLLLEFSQGLPDLPPRLAEHRELLEPVPECQSPIFLAVEVAGAGEPGAQGSEKPGPDSVVRLHFSAPPEAPTTRGFAGILHEGLDGLTAAEVLAVPDDLPLRLSLTDQVSPLRLRGMSGMLARIKGQVRRALQPA